MKSSAATPDLEQTLDAFLLLTYARVVAAEHTKAVPLVEIARKLAIPEGLAEKVAAFLETEGLVDYDDQAVDITITGMLRAEGLMAETGRGKKKTAVRRSR